MTLVRNTRHAADGEATLLAQFQGLPNWQAIMGPLWDQVQELEDAFWQLYTERLLDAAVGEQLDVIGRVINRKRGSYPAGVGAGAGEPWVDDLYRAILRGHVHANLASGGPEEILRMTALVLTDFPAVEIRAVEQFPHQFEIQAAIGALIEGLAQAFKPLLVMAKATSVRALFTYHTTDPVFQFDGANGSKFDGGYHFAATL